MGRNHLGLLAVIRRRFEHLGWLGGALLVPLPCLARYRFRFKDRPRVTLGLEARQFGCDGILLRLDILKLPLKPGLSLLTSLRMPGTWHRRPLPAAHQDKHGHHGKRAR